MDESGFKGEWMVIVCIPYKRNGIKAYGLTDSRLIRLPSGITLFGHFFGYIMRLLATLLLAYGIITVAQAFGVHFIPNSSTKANNQEALNEIRGENGAGSPVPSQKAESSEVTKESVSTAQSVTPLGDGAIEDPLTGEAVTILTTEAITDAIPFSKIAETESVAVTGTQASTLAASEQNLDEQVTEEAPQISSISSAPLQSDSIIGHTTIDSSTEPLPGPSSTSTIEAGSAESASHNSQVTSQSGVSESREALGGTSPTSPPALSSAEVTIVSEPVQSEIQTSAHPSGHNDASHEAERADQLSTQPKVYTPLSPDNIQRSTAAYTTSCATATVGEPGNPPATRSSDNTIQNEAQNQDVQVSTGKPTSAHSSVPQSSSYGQTSTPNSDTKAGIDKSVQGTEFAENSSGSSETTKLTPDSVGEKIQDQVGSTGSSQPQTAQPRVGIDGAQDGPESGLVNGSPSAPNKNREQTHDTKSLGGKPTLPHSSTPQNSGNSEAKIKPGTSSKETKYAENSSGSSETTKLTPDSVGEKIQDRVGSTGSSQPQTAQPRVGIDGAQDGPESGLVNGSPSAPNKNREQTHDTKSLGGKPTLPHSSTPQNSGNSEAKIKPGTSSKETKYAENSSGSSETTKLTPDSVGEKIQDRVGSTGSSQPQTAQPRVGIDGTQDVSKSGSANGSPSAPNKNREQTHDTNSLAGKPTSPHSSAPLDANTLSTSSEQLNLIEGKVGSDVSSKGIKSEKSTSGSNGSTELAAVKDHEGLNSAEPSLDDNHSVVTRTHNSPETGSDGNKLTQHYENPQAIVDEKERSVSTKKAEIKARKCDSSMSNPSSLRRCARIREVVRHLLEGGRESHHSQSAGGFESAQLSSKSDPLNSFDFGPTGLDTRASGSVFHSPSSSSLSTHAASGPDQIIHPLRPDSGDFENSDDDDDKEDLSDDDDDDEDEDSEEERVKNVLAKEPNEEEDDDDKTEGAKNPLVKDTDDDKDDKDEIEAKLPRRSHEEDEDDDEEEKRAKGKLSSKKELKYEADIKGRGHLVKGPSSRK
ncbi:unnamed protein product [Calicophoron daubneyi]|uniref:Uncharacterized protein n=1 Tax=Calicophoron daubneyi TaxID=300641 RepID=A0AAV2THL8_CALDB